MICHAVPAALVLYKMENVLLVVILTVNNAASTHKFVRFAPWLLLKVQLVPFVSLALNFAINVR